MTGGAPLGGRRIGFGTYRRVALDVAVWDAVGADVDLSCACMFTREIGRGPTGGLEHLDGVLAGALLSLRRDGIFRGELMDSLMLRPGSKIRGRGLLMVGLGDPDAWTPAVMSRVTRYMVAEGNNRGIASAGIAPGLLDSGLAAKLAQDASEAMFEGVTAGVDASYRLAEIGLAPPPSLKSWTFGAGAAHAEEAAEYFRRRLSSKPMMKSQ